MAETNCKKGMTTVKLKIRQLVAPVAMFNLGLSCLCSCMSMAGACTLVPLGNYYVQMFMANTCARMRIYSMNVYRLVTSTVEQFWRL